MKADIPQATSFLQQRCWEKNTIPEPEEILPNLWMVAMPMVGGGMPYSFGYVKFGRSGVHILDPGSRGEANFERLRSFLAEHGRGIHEITQLVATHGHPDHVSLAATLVEESGAQFTMSGVEARILAGEVQTDLRNLETVESRLIGWGVPNEVREALLPVFMPRGYPAPAAPDTFIEPGGEYDFGGISLTAIHTPGHTGGHLCFAAYEQRLLFSGDHVLPQISPGLGLGSLPDSDPVGDYIASLKSVKKFESYEVLPGHEYRFRGVSAAADRIAAHHLRKSFALREVAQELGDATVWEYAQHVPWSRGWEKLSGFLLHAALTQTELHLNSLKSGALGQWLDGQEFSKPEN